MGPAATHGGITLSVSIDLTYDDPLILPRLEWGAKDGTGLGKYGLADFGVPDDASTPTRLTLPPNISDDLGSRLDSAPTGPVWLRLEPPAGYLAAVPWEGIELRDRVLLRLPDDMVVPQYVTSYRRLAIVACAVQPFVPPVVNHVREMVDQLGRLVPLLEVHLFGDDDVCRDVQEAWAGDPLRAVHRLAPESMRQAVGAGPFPVERITEALGGQSVQAVHLLLPGVFDGTRAALAAGGLSGGASVGYAGADDVKGFVDALGAPMVSVTPAPGGDWTAARMVADTVGATRPGPTICASFDPPMTSSRNLAAAHDVIANRRSALSGALPAGPSMFYYLQPDVFVEPPPVVRRRGGPSIPVSRSPWRGGVGAEMLWRGPPQATPAEVPLWATASKRFVESRRTELDRQTNVETGTRSAYLDGAVAALGDIQQFLDRAVVDPS